MNSASVELTPPPPPPPNPHNMKLNMYSCMYDMRIYYEVRGNCLPWPWYKKIKDLRDNYLSILYLKGITCKCPACREACRNTPTSIRLSSHFVRVPNLRSGRHEFVSSVWRELGALTKLERSLWSGLSTG
jgi:hypothetical protein